MTAWDARTCGCLTEAASSSSATGEHLPRSTSINRRDATMAIETGTPPVALPRASDRGETLTVRDAGTGRTSVSRIQDGAIRATELNRIRTAADDPGLLTYDPGFMATAAVKSAVTYIDGDAGILRYRGHPIEEATAKSGV